MAAGVEEMNQWKGLAKICNQSDASMMVSLNSVGLMWAEWAANSLPFLSKKFQVSVAGGAGGNIEQGSSDFPITRLDQWWTLISQFFHLNKLTYNFDTQYTKLNLLPVSVHRNSDSDHMH